MQVRIITIFLLIATYAFGGDTMKPGDTAPEFKLKDEAGKIHSLADYKGKQVALYFYPKDDTPGCTAEACNLRDNYESLQQAGVVILGVSYDDSTSHKAFKEKYNLPFPLLSDTEKEVAKAYGAKSLLTGIFVPQRKTFLIDADGKILHIFDDVDTQNHASQILSVLEANKIKP